MIAKSLMKDVVFGAGCLAGLLFISPAEACNVSGAKNLGLYASFERGSTGIYGKSLKPSEISGCRTPGKFLMIGIGAEHQDYGYRLSANFGTELLDPKCRINGDQGMRLDPFEKIQAFYTEKNKFLQSCIRTTVEDMGGIGIPYPAGQTRCQIKRISASKLEFTGNVCFLDPGVNNQLIVSHSFAPECMDRTALAELGVQPMDVPAIVNFYLAGDASGFSTDLKTLATTKIRFSIDPSTDLMRVSEDLGDTLPRWPSAWTPDIHVGGLEARTVGEEQIEFKVNFLVDNTCPEKCAKGLCSSPCNYSTPIAAEMSLNEIGSGNRRVTVDTFSVGGMAYPRWQGILRSVPRYLDPGRLKPGARYEAEIVFRDPFEDYFALVNQISQMLIPLGGMVNLTVGTDVYGGIPSLGKLSNLPSLPSLGSPPPVVDSNTIPSQMGSALDQLGGLFKFQAWPSYFDRFCSKDFKACTPKLTSRNVVFKIQFKVEAKEGSEFVFSPLHVKRESSILPSYERDVTEPLEVRCGGT